MTTQNSQPNPDQIIQAVFSVCASGDLVPSAMAAIAKVEGAEFAGEFQEYITANRRPQFSAALKSALGCVALIDCDREPELAIETMERLQLAFPSKMSLIAVGTASDASFLLKAMRAGCNEFLSKPVDSAQLAAALTRFQTTYAFSANKPQSTGKVISFFGAKGGVGATTLAVHLATHLVRNHRKKVLLIDYMHELGHVALHLGIQNCIYYFDELIRNVDRLDADLLEGFVTRHGSGLDVIPSPDRFALQHETPPGTIERVMEYLRTRYDFILLDASMQYSDSLASLVMASDEVSLVCTPDVAALRDLVRHIEHISHMKGSSGKLRVIINRSGSDDAVNSDQIQNAVQFPVSIGIPNSYRELVRAINAGEPVSPQHKGPFSQAIEKWAVRLTTDMISATAATASRSKKRFALWR